MMYAQLSVYDFIFRTIFRREINLFTPVYILLISLRIRPLFNTPLCTVRSYMRKHMCCVYVSSLNWKYVQAKNKCYKSMTIIGIYIYSLQQQNNVIIFTSQHPIIIIDYFFFVLYIRVSFCLIKYGRRTVSMEFLSSTVGKR